MVNCVVLLSDGDIKGIEVKLKSDDRNKQFKNILRKSLKSKKPVIINIEVNPKSIYSFRKDSFKHKLKV